MSSAFRITQRSIATSSLAGLQANLARLQATQAKLSSGKAISRPSDSPTGTMSALRLRTDIDRYDQLDRNAADGLARLGTTDNALTDGLSTLREARNLVVQGTNDPRVPKEESDQVVERLRARGIPVEYMVFEDEGHGFTKRANQDKAHDRIVDFLTEQLGA